MKKRALKILSMLLCCLMLLSAVSCNNGGTQTDTENAGTENPAGPAPISEILLDDGYSPVAVEAGKYEYKVSVPLGNPRIPLVSADVEGAEINQDYCLREDGTASALISFSSDGKDYTYTLNFVPEGTETVIQFGDNIQFVPDYNLKEGESFTFESSDIYTVYIETDGYYYARKTSSDPVTLTAKVKGAVVDTLVISRIVPAQTLYLVLAGGINATTEYGDTTEADSPREGTMFYVADSGNIKKISGCGGFLPSLAKKWYSSTNEKVVADIAATPTARMSDWQEGGSCLTSATATFSSALEKAAADNSNYEIRHFGFVFMGGESDHDADAVEYADMITGVIDTLEAVHPFDFCAIVPCRAGRSTGLSADRLIKLDGPRAAAFSLHNYRENIFIGSLAAEDATYENGLAEKENVRLTQKCYNTIGNDIASTALARMKGDTAVESIVILGAEGTNITDGTSAVPDGKSLAAYTLPLTAKSTLNVSAEGEGLVTSRTGIVYTEGSTGGGTVKFECSGKNASLTLSAYTVPAEESDPYASATLRQKAVYAMKQLATISWLPVYDVKHGSGCTYVSQAFTPQKGIPYGSTRGTLEEFQALLVDGIYFGSSPASVTNNCTSALALALAKADPKIEYMLSDKVDQISSYLSPMYTGYGVSKLGDYTVTVPTDRDEFNVVTWTILSENGQDKMYECYALLEAGDYVMMRKGTSNSHCRLVVSNTVTRDKNGKVTGGTITVIEQGAGHSNRNGAYSSYSTSSKVTYSELFDGFYVPMTLDVYHQ